MVYISPSAKEWKLIVFIIVLADNDYCVINGSLFRANLSLCFPLIINKLEFTVSLFTELELY
jgi:hypothetical protein